MKEGERNGQFLSPPLQRHVDGKASHLRHALGLSLNVSRPNHFGKIKLVFFPSNRLASDALVGVISSILAVYTQFIARDMPFLDARAMRICNATTRSIKSDCQRVAVHRQHSGHSTKGRCSHRPRADWPLLCRSKHLRRGTRRHLAIRVARLHVYSERKRHDRTLQTRRKLTQVESCLSSDS